MAYASVLDDRTQVFVHLISLLGVWQDAGFGELHRGSVASQAVLNFINEDLH